MSSAGDHTGPSTTLSRHDGDEAYCSACGKSFPFEADLCPNDGARLTKLRAKPDEMLGRIFDARYEVRSVIGHGGMGTVYRGWQLSVDREVAIKVIHAKLASDRTAVKRFLREARLSSRLSQPSIVNVYDFGQTDDGVLFLVMELLRGHTLSRELEAQRPLPLRRVATIATQICDALDSAHNQGIIHRDLKPGNIVILDDPPGRDLVKILDFGLAKSLGGDTSSVVTNTSAIIGTPLYMAPEQISSKPTDQRTDLYSLGCVLHHMLDGKPPFLGDNVNIVLAMHLNQPPPPLPPGVPPVLASTIRALLEKNPAKRPASAAVVREALRATIESGYAMDELSDTTPDIAPPHSVDIPDAYAITAAALAESLVDTGSVSETGSTVLAGAGAVVLESAAVPRSTPEAVGLPVSRPPVPLPSAPQRRSRWIAPALAGVLAVAGVGGYLATRGTSKRSPAAPAAPAPGAPAASASVPADAATAVDATMPEQLDAALAATPPIDAAEQPAAATTQLPAKPTKPKPTKPTKPKPKPDEPSLDFIKPK